jgi:hypothetical protein
MLRFLYGCVLRAHPVYFRRRFAEEMLSIFDQAETPTAAAGLVLDGVVSLFRQRVFRPEFGEGPRVEVSADGAPLFSTFESPRPGTGALIYGALLSLLVLNGICWTMGYAWNHPSFVWIQQPVIRPPAAWYKMPPDTPGGSGVREQPLYTDEGRVLLVFNSGASHTSDPGTAPPATAKQAMPGVAPQADPALHLRPDVLQSYVGMYRANAGKSDVKVTVEQEQLRIDAGQFKSRLVPVSENQFVASDVADCQIEFAKGSTGAVDRLEIHKDGHRITALRQ